MSITPEKCHCCTLFLSVSIPLEGSVLQCALMLQVDKAFEHLLSYADAAERNIRFMVSCSEHRFRGIYLREAHQTSKPSEHVVTVEPVYRDTDDGW